jgi:hypothetical protein
MKYQFIDAQSPRQPIIPSFFSTPGDSCVHKRIIRADSNMRKATDVLGRCTEHRLVAADAPVFDTVE